MAGRRENERVKMINGMEKKRSSYSYRTVDEVPHLGDCIPHPTAIFVYIVPARQLHVVARIAHTFAGISINILARGGSIKTSLSLSRFASHTACIRNFIRPRGGRYLDLESTNTLLNELV